MVVESLSEQPRCMQALDVVDRYIESAPQQEISRYIDSQSRMAQAALWLDNAQNDHYSLATVNYVAGLLRKEIDTYDGPREIADVYQDLYGKTLNEILGEQQ